MQLALEVESRTRLCRYMCTTHGNWRVARIHNVEILRCAVVPTGCELKFSPLGLSAMVPVAASIAGQVHYVGAASALSLKVKVPDCETVAVGENCTFTWHSLRCPYRYTARRNAGAAQLSYVIWNSALATTRSTVMGAEPVFSR